MFFFFFLSLFYTSDDDYYLAFFSAVFFTANACWSKHGVVAKNFESVNKFRYQICLNGPTWNVVGYFLGEAIIHFNFLRTWHGMRMRVWSVRPCGLTGPAESADGPRDPGVCSWRLEHKSYIPVFYVVRFELGNTLAQQKRYRRQTRATVAVKNKEPRFGNN